MIRKILKMLRIPEQPVALVPFLFGAIDAGYFKTEILVPVGLGLLLLSIGSFVINEYIDSFDTDATNPRKDRRFNFAKHRKITLSIFLFLNLIGGAILIYYGLIIPLAIFLFFATFYSVPPLRFKGRFPWDMIAPLIAWGAVPYSLAFSLNGLPYSAIISVASLSMASFGIVMQGIHYLADAEEDKKAGLQNWCIVLGYHNFVRVIDKFAIAGLLGLLYLLYRHQSWWYYPIILASIYELLVIGYARAAIYQPTLERLHSIAIRSYKKGILVFIAVLAYQIWVILKLSGKI